MRIIHTTDLSKEYKDCYINVSVSLVEAFGMYTVIEAWKISDWHEDNTISVSAPVVDDLDVAKQMYEQYGGIITV